MVETIQQNRVFPKISTDKAPMPHTNLALRLFFRFLQLFASITLRMYFRRIEIINPESLNTSGRLIVISNHPNTLIDPLMALQQLFVRPFLLANASLFKQFIPQKILSALYCLPLKRAKDFDSGFVNNNQIFARCITHLQEGGSLYIAPEGTSENERHVRPFKKGLAHIYEQAQREGMTDLKILMVGLTYFNPQKANSDVVIEVSEPFQPKIENSTLNSHGKKLDTILEQIESHFHQTVIHCEDSVEEKILEKTEILVQSEHYLPLREKYFRSKNILEKLRRTKQENANQFSQFETDINNYFSLLEKNNLRDVNIQKYDRLKNLFILLILSPFSIFGLVANTIPLTLIGLLRRSRYFNFESDYYTCVQYVSGLILYPLFWCLEWLLVSGVWYQSFPTTNSSPFKMLYLASVIGCGFIARAEWVRLKKYLNYLRTVVKGKELNLSELRSSIIQRL